VSSQVDSVAELDLPMCLSLKQQGQGCLRWLACWATWATNKESPNPFFFGVHSFVLASDMFSDVFVLFPLYR
jgi:hypothetical protein